MTTSKTLNETDHDEIEALFIGRRIVSAEMGAVEIPTDANKRGYWDSQAEGIITLDDGTRIYAKGNDGGCACDAGCYPLAHLAGVDNVITAVRFEDCPDNDDRSGDGWYRIFVIADAVEINVASFEGSDGNGYYGTGYSLYVHRPEES